MNICAFVLATLCVAFTNSQRYQEYTTPVPILKQIDKHNEDGSYSYGYEAADGTFKIETKYPNGEVFGKYGYVDDSGQIREVEYGASRRGFEPSGTDVNAAPPTLTNNNYPVAPLGPNEEDDGQYREDPSVYYKNEQYNQPDYRQNNYQASNYQQPSYQQPSYQQPSYQQPRYQQPQSYQVPSYRPAYNPPQPQSRFGFNSNPQPSYNSGPSSHRGTPFSNFDIGSGSYSVNYR